MYISKPGITRAKGLRFFAIDYVCFKARTTKHKKTSQQESDVFHDEFVHASCSVVQCFSIKCKKRHHKYCVSRTKLLSSGDIELNPEPVILGK